MPQDYAVSQSKSEESAFSSLMNRFNMCNDRQTELLSKIDERLNNILSKRSPQSPPTGPMEKKIDNDFVSSFESQLSRLANSNDFIDKLFSHLSQIV